MSVTIRIYTKLGKENVYTFEGYSALNNTLTVYSNLGSEDVNICNLKRVIESEKPCKIHIADRSNDVTTTTECLIEGATLSDNNKIIYQLAKTTFTSHRG